MRRTSETTRARMRRVLDLLCRTNIGSCASTLPDKLATDVDAIRWLRVVARIALVFLFSSAALADEPSRAGEAAATARALFRAGRADVEAGRWADALDKFQESYSLEPAMGTLLNLAQCEEQLGRIAAAWKHYQEVAERLPESDARVRVATGRARTLDPRVPRLTVSLDAAAPPNASIVRDGIAMGASSLGLALPVEVGAHTIVTSAPGRAANRLVLELKEGERRSLQALPGPPLSPTPPADPRIETPPAPMSDSTALRAPNGTRVAGFVTLGIGALTTVAGGVLGAIVLSKKSTADAHCPPPARICDSDGEAAVDSGRMLAPISTVTLLVGAAALGAGALLLLLSANAKAARP
jgi:hypothetical protein